MLRFGGLKYKKLNNADHPDDGAENDSASPPGSPAKGGGKPGKSVHSTPTTSPKQQQRLHNQLNGTAMKNVNTPRSASTERKKHRTNLMLIVGSLSGKTLPEADTSKSPSNAAVQPSSPSSNFRLLSGKFAVDSKRKINCKTRIYKCIKRILKRNTCNTGQPKDAHRGVRSPKAGYREIKTLLEKQNRDLDVNLAKCVEKPAFIKKIAINMLQSAVGDDKEDVSSVLHREQTASVTASIQSGLERDREYRRLLDECWYHEDVPRNMCLELLMDKEPGSFLVRKSTSQPDCYALSLRVPPGSGSRIAHYLIVRTPNDGYKIKGFRKEFGSLRTLIVHHSVMRESLPIPLDVPRPLVVKTKFDDDYEAVFNFPRIVRH